MKKQFWARALCIALVLTCLVALMGIGFSAFAADDADAQESAVVAKSTAGGQDEGETKKDLSFFARIIELFSNEAYMDTIWEGLVNTLIISVFAALLGLLLGTLIAFVTIAQKSPWLVVPKWICRIFVTIVRGTPMALQLFIMAYVIFAIRGFPELVTAIIAFGLNSSAYISENIRAGILSVDKGQTEAGRALGLPSRITMMKIVIPQAIKNVIPAIGNELIALIKETSIVSMIGMFDLTMAAKIIGGGNNMASYIVPMTVVALFYLGIVYLLTFAIKMIERRLRASDRN